MKGSRLLTAVLMANLLLGALVALEVAGRLAAYGADSWRRDGRADADSYSKATWVDPYYREFRASGAVDWTPYVYWRRRPFQGQFINIGEGGIRRTWAAASGAARHRVFVMGGSTVWGTGARDDETLPSHLARELAAKGMLAEVINYGESGYVTRQDIATLVTRLKAGDVPDAVVFYGGINDVFSAFQSGVAGLPQNEATRAVEFNATRPENLGKVARVLTSGTQTVADAIRRRLLRRAAAVEPTRPETGTALASAVIDGYCGDLRTIRALGAEYGFRPLFFWQPVIFTKPQLTTYERAELNRFNYLMQFFALTYAKIDSGKQPCDGAVVHDLSGLFLDEARPMYLDAFHLSEAGNRFVARAMTPDVSAALDRSPR